MSTARPRVSRVRLLFRTLVLLLALSVPAGHVTAAQAEPVPGAVQEYEQDVSAAPALPGARARHRADVPDRAAPLPGPAPAPPGADPVTGRTRPPCAAPLLRTVVLRC